MKNTPPPPWQNERGSTLILVVLLTLILSASAIVVLRNVARTTQGAAVFRTRNQAQMTSDSANRMFGDWVGNKAATLIDAMKNANYGTAGADSNIFGAGATTPPGFTDQTRREALAILGGQLDFTYADLAQNCGPGCTPLITDHGNPAETGLFQLAAGDETFESRRSARWRVRVRDLTDGFPAVGYSGEFCFKKAVIAAESVVGRVEADWDRINNVAQARHVTDAMIGPVECGYN